MSNSKEQKRLTDSQFAQYEEIFCPKSLVERANVTNTENPKIKVSKMYVFGCL